MNSAEKFMLRIIKHKVSKWFELEHSIAKLEHTYQSVEESPEKSWPNPDKIPSGDEVPFSFKNIQSVGKSLRSCIHQGTKAIRTISRNPKHVNKTIDVSKLDGFEAFAKLNGIGGIGYAKLPSHLIFKDRAVLYDTAIVLIAEMDKEAILQAPSLETFKMVMSTYDDLGTTTNVLTDKLRHMGFQAQASHPLGGLVLYPPLAAAAGLGWLGRHGLLITPQFGPRQRISAIFVNIDNLPIANVNEHSWIEGFCKNCGKCIKSCPSQAIMTHPIEHKSGRRTHVIREKCLSVFVKQQGCTVCVKACTFTQANYSDLYERFKNRNEKSKYYESGTDKSGLQVLQD